MKIPDQRSWMVDIGRSNTEKLLELAGADTPTFCQAYNEMMEYVGDLGNLQSIKDELKVRRVAAVNIFDIVIDFCLLDSFDDLDMPPASVTAVLGNSWISQGLRKTMLSTAVWGMISTKTKKAQPDGFLCRFYAIMAVVTPSLAWGFLGDDAVLKPICSSIRENVMKMLLKAFDEDQTDYSSLDSLAEALYSLLQMSANQLLDQLNDAMS
ncbi:mitoguardin-like [Bolinopsis microptera]|uniref:mitoguardin-like n=1 Tax=Bolinopsis microptera TaxID=2820187 RepID=UPI003078E60D